MPGPSAQAAVSGCASAAGNDPYQAVTWEGIFISQWRKVRRENLISADSTRSERCRVHGRAAGRLLEAARSSDTADVLVMAQAVEAGGDPRRGRPPPSRPRGGRTARPTPGDPLRLARRSDREDRPASLRTPRTLLRGRHSRPGHRNARHPYPAPLPGTPTPTRAYPSGWCPSVTRDLL